MIIRIAIRIIIIATIISHMLDSPSKNPQDRESRARTPCVSGRLIPQTQESARVAPPNLQMFAS